MKRILGLDLGTNSIGWAVVDEAENCMKIKIPRKLAGLRLLRLIALL